MKIIKYITGFVLAGILFTSCIKDDEPSLGTKGNPFVKILEAPENNLFFTPFSSVDTVDLFSLRREEVSSTAMAEAKTVQLIIDTAAITEYNEANGTNYELLPDSLYTLVGSDNSVSGLSVSMTIPTDAISSEFYVTLNGSKWDLTHKYALPVVITDSAGSKIRSGMNQVMVTLAIKNQWDRDYQSTGYFYHPASPRALSLSKHLGTVSPTSVYCDLGDLGGSGYVALLTIDPITNKVTISDYSTGIPIDGLDALPTTNPGYTAAWSGSDQCNNTYDPVTGIFYLRMAYLGSTGWRVSEEILTPQ